MSRNLWSAVYLVLIACFGIIMASGYWFGLSWNVSPSLPTGIYRQEKGDLVIIKGKVVSFCPPNTTIFRFARDQRIIRWGFCPHGFSPLLKRVAAIAGDTVFVNRRVIVNGSVLNNSYIASEAATYFGAITSSKILEDEDLWVMGDTNDSFDSRYFGVISLNSVIGVQRLVF